MGAAFSVPLGNDQVLFFKTFGYLVLREFFTAQELETIHREFDYKLEEQYPGQPYDGSRRYWAPLLDEDTPFFAGMLEDKRFLTIARQLYGDDVLGMNTDGNRYTGNTRWHPDTGSVHQYGVKFAFYLEPVDAETGALRVIPGTHRLQEIDEFRTGVEKHALPDVPCEVLTSSPGDVVAFDLRLWHASYGGSEDRKMCTLVYYNNPKNGDEVAALQRQSRRSPESSIKKFNTKQQFLYSKRWISNPSGSPDRQLWIDRLREIGYLDAPGVVEA